MSQHNRMETFQQYGKALTKLEEALERSAEQDDLVIDAVIQRFEFTIELCWKTLKKALADEGLEATTPRHVLQQAYAVQWIDQEEIWLEMLRDRNLTSHTYKEEQAKEIYQRIPRYASEMRKLYVFLEKQLLL